MDKYFSIGQISKLHKISIQTLRYYDKIGLFKPSYTNQENSYRYYTAEQFFFLDMIKFLKNIGTSLEDIRCLLDKSAMEDIINLLDDRDRALTSQIIELEHRRKQIRHTISRIKSNRNRCNIGEIYIRNIERVDAVCMNLNNLCLNDVDNYNLQIKKLCSLMGEFDLNMQNELGFSASRQQYAQSGEVRYNSVYMKISQEYIGKYPKKNILTMPRGEYLCLSFRGFGEEAESSYKKLYQYIVDHDIRTGESFYEELASEGMVTTNDMDCISEIKIFKKPS